MLSCDDEEDEMEDDRDAGRFSPILKERLRAGEGFSIPVLRGDIDSNCDAIVVITSEVATMI